MTVESAKSLIVDRTHLVQVSGKLVLQKRLCTHRAMVLWLGTFLARQEDLSSMPALSYVVFSFGYRFVEKFDLGFLNEYSLRIKP